MSHETAVDESLPDPSPLVALAFLTPWALVAVFLPDPWRMAAIGLVTLLALLLLAAAAFSFREAHRRGLDASRWAFVTVLTLGLGMFAVLAARPSTSAATYVCSECGRVAPMVETFCHGCGAM